MNNDTLALIRAQIIIHREVIRLLIQLRAIIADDPRRDYQLSETVEKIDRHRRQVARLITERNFLRQSSNDILADLKPLIQ
jgi:hypothetical protein